jgi:hypothetical protein
MRKVAAEDPAYATTLDLLRAQNPGMIDIARSKPMPSHDAYRSAGNTVNGLPSLVRNVGGNLRWLYNNPEEAANNFQAAQQQQLNRQQKALNYLYNWGNKVAPRINQEAGHIANRIAPAVGQVGGTFVSSGRDMYNSVADFANKVGEGWGGKLAENIGRHVRNAGDAVLKESDKWDVAGLDAAEGRSIKSFDRLGNTLMNKFTQGFSR